MLIWNLTHFCIPKRYIFQIAGKKKEKRKRGRLYFSARAIVIIIAWQQNQTCAESFGKAERNDSFDGVVPEANNRGEIEGKRVEVTI